MNTQPTEALAKVGEFPPASVEENRRDRDVLHLALARWNVLPEPRPDLPTWLNGASTALLLLRKVKP